MTECIEIKNVSKKYGKKQALKNISLTIDKGMFGLLGRNGAGKTTLMKVLSTLLDKSEGSITICGIDIKKTREIRNIIGYLPQDFSIYGGMTVYEAMDYLGVLSGINKGVRRKRIPELLEKVNLKYKQKVKVKVLSGGMKRRLGIAQALLNDPKILIVDEPTAGLDPEERVRFRNLLSEIADDRIVILSTHIVGDIEAVCERIAILDEGCLIYYGTVNDLLKQADGKVYTLEISGNEIEKMKRDYIVTAIMKKGMNANIRFLSDDNPISNSVAVEPNVEDAYMQLLHLKGMVKNCD